MLFSTWLRNYKRSLECRSALMHTRRRKSSVRRVALRPRLEALEDRTLLSAYVVTTTADSGAGSLRDAINQINADTSHALYASPSNPNVDEIDFNITAASDAAGGGTGYNATTGVATIQPQSVLAPITNSVIINGYTQGHDPSYTPAQVTQYGASPNTLTVGDNASLKIDLDGSKAGLVNGLNIGSNSTVEGLAVTNFGNGQTTGVPAPVAISAGGNNQIIGDFIGTDVSGTVEEGNEYGIAVFRDGNTIGGTDPAMRNVIGGNGLWGVYLDSSGNVVEGNYIGTDHTGTEAFGNGRGVVDGGSNNTIGGSASGAGNVISANEQIGIHRNAAATGEVIQGNFIGTDATGTLGLGNGLPGFGYGDGIRIDYNGGSVTITGNVISANPTGIFSNGHAVVQGNLIGTDATGKTTTGTDGKSLGNTLAMYDNAPTLIGGPNAADRNVISGNGDGILVNSGDVIQGNYIGTDITGTHALGNAGSSSNPGVNVGGIDIQGTATTLTVVGNLISGNGIGMNIRGGDGSGCKIQGNLIGTDYTGTQPLGNANGIAFYADCNYTIGGTTAGAGNDISGNGEGISMVNYGTPVGTGNAIEGNFIGTNVAGATNLGNGTGVYIEGYFSGTQIGGTTAAAANVIAHNGGEGIFFNGSSGNVIQGNSIIENGGDGIHLQSSFNNMVGGTTSGAGNTIASNGAAGIAVVGLGPDPAGSGNSFLENSIHDNASLGIYLINNNANDNQAAPVLTTATTSATSTTVSGTLASVDNTTFRIEFFSNAGLDTHENAEGQTYLGFATLAFDSSGNPSSPDGSATVSVNNSGVATFTATNLAAIPIGQGYLTATITNNNTRNSSEFSNYLTAPTSTVLTSSANPSLLNQSATFTTTVSSSFGTPTGSVDFVDTTTGTDLGKVALSASGAASVTVSNLTLGAHVIEATYAGQGFFLGSSGTLTQQVSYKFSGFLPPLSNGLNFAVNRTIPIKFQLADANGNTITSLSAVTSLQIFNSQGTDVLGGNGVAGLSVSGSTYSYNWQTKGQPPGSYTISVKLTDGTTQTKTIQLTAGGNSAGLVTDGSVGTSTAGALLGGEVDLYVDNSNGDLTSDELARINDAVTSIDATIAPYGVTIVEVSDPTHANVTLSMNSTSSLGGAAQGVLGCTTDADQVTMIQGWNWYAGADPTQVGSGQYDFETAVIHELGHVLGLGHSSDSSSVMYSTLTAGTANRALVAADLNVPDDGGSCALHAVAIASVASKSNGQSITAPSSTSVPSSGSPLSAVDQAFANLALLLSEVRNAYQSKLSSVTVMWHTIDALAWQRLDALLSLEAGVLGIHAALDDSY